MHVHVTRRSVPLATRIHRIPPPIGNFSVPVRRKGKKATGVRNRPPGCSDLESKCFEGGLFAVSARSHCRTITPPFPSPVRSEVPPSGRPQNECRHAGTHTSSHTPGHAREGSTPLSVADWQGRRAMIGHRAPCSLAGLGTALLAFCATEVGARRRGLRSPSPLHGRPRWAPVAPWLRRTAELPGFPCKPAARPRAGLVPQYAASAARCLVLSAPPVGRELGPLS